MTPRAFALVALVALVVGWVLGEVGSRLVARGLPHLLPEHRGRAGNGAVWTLRRYAPEGRRLLVRGWLLQLGAAALLLLAAGIAFLLLRIE